MNSAYNPARRDFLKNMSKAAISTTLVLPVFSGIACAGENNTGDTAGDIDYTQQPLKYGYNAIEPVIDAMTMEIHYTKHAATYAKALGEAVKDENVNTASTSLPQLLSGISKYSAKMRNNAGGHYNHELFWRSLKAPADNNAPAGKLAARIEQDFNSFDAFKAQFTEAAKNRFGSGWAWLVYSNNKLVVSSTPNQDNPLMDLAETKGFPVLGLDVWEHAYYLKYQNKRPDYVSAWWNAINWDYVQQRFSTI